MRSQGRFFRFLCALAIVGMVAAACGSDEDATSTTTGSTGDTSAGETPIETRVIKIGMAFPDLSAFEILNDAFVLGDPELQAEALINSWRNNDVLPEGIDIEIVTTDFAIADEASKQAACVKLGNEEDMFAVIGARNFEVGASCLVDRFDIPVIDRSPSPPSVYARSNRLFTLLADQSSWMRNYGKWVVDNIDLEGKTIGLYFETRIEEGIPALKEELANAGYEVAVEVSTSGEGVGANAEDSIAVARFQEEDVDVVLPILGSSGVNNVMRTGVSQGYEPVYAANDYGEQTGDTSAAVFPEIFEGALGMTMTRSGEVSGAGLNAPGQECIETYNEFAGEEIPIEAPEDAEFTNVLLTCDLLTITLAGITGAADDLTQDNFIAAIENAGEFEFASVGNGSFSADDHSGTDGYRTVQWSFEPCSCWAAIGDFQPMIGPGRG